MESEKEGERGGATGFHAAAKTIKKINKYAWVVPIDQTPHITSHHITYTRHIDGATQPANRKKRAQIRHTNIIINIYDLQFNVSNVEMLQNEHHKP